MNKGLIFDIRRFSVHDGPGIRTTVFFKGCPLTCCWCHNPEGQFSQPESFTRKIEFEDRIFEEEQTAGSWMSVEDVLEKILEDKVFYDESGGGVTFSGGEPLMQPEFLQEILRMSKTASLHTALDTCGYAEQEVVSGIMDLVDLFLFDIKLLNKELHMHYSGVPNHPILDNLELLCDKGKNIIIRFPVIPGITDTEDNICQLKNLLTLYNGHIHEIDLLPWHSFAKGKYSRFNKSNKMEEVPDLKVESLEGLKKELERTGLIVKIGG